MTTKIDCTTAEVVCSPTDCALPLTRKPSMHPITAIRKAKIGALAMPMTKCLSPTLFSITEMNIVGEMSSVIAHTSMPPTMPEIIATKVSIGSASSSAATRGSTSSSTGSRPSTRMASTSSFARIEPICAVNELAVRPATMMAVSSTPNSRKKE